MDILLKVSRNCWSYLDLFFNKIFTPKYNPLYFLGAISVFFLWVIILTGFYLFFYYNMSSTGAYKSIEYLSVDQWYLGGIIRSMHRLASAGLVVAMILHAIHIFSTDRFRDWRWIAWVTGVGSFWFIIVAGILGYILVWDSRALFSAQTLALMLDSIPILSKPISFAFTHTPSNFFFYIVLFVHFFTPVFIYLLTMIHTIRMKTSRINPPKNLVYALLIILVVVSIIEPASNTAPADISKMPEEIPFDWFYFFFFPLVKYMSIPTVWALLIGITLFFFFVPWYFGKSRKDAVEINPENCTGCEQCVSDCPYEAVFVQPRTDGRSYDLEAVVSAERCASCGICVGSCDYKAINLPYLKEQTVKDDIARQVANSTANNESTHLFVFLCEKGLSPSIYKELDKMNYVQYFTFPCIGMVQSAMISIPFNEGFDGLFIASCQEGDCHYRFGNKWLHERISGLRKPLLRKNIDRSKIKIFMGSQAEGKKLLSEIKLFKDELKKTIEVKSE